MDMFYKIAHFLRSKGTANKQGNLTVGEYSHRSDDDGYTTTILKAGKGVICCQTYTFEPVFYNGCSPEELTSIYNELKERKDWKELFETKK